MAIIVIIILLTLNYEIYDLVKLNSSSALCLDGSPGSYYVSQTGDPSKILILFQGGGWSAGEDD